jgi:hypothetical protein
MSLGKGGGYDVNVSYAVFDRFILFATGTLNKGTKKRFGIFGDRYNAVKDDYALTYGVGYFKNEEDRDKTFETYAGFGKYTVDNHWYFPDHPALAVEFTQAHYWNLFLQCNWGRKKAKSEVAFAGRVAYSEFHDVVFYQDSAPTEESRYKGLKGLNFEPAASIGYSLKSIFINAQIGTSIPLIKSNVTQITTFRWNSGATARELKTSEKLFAFFARLSLQYKIHFNKVKQ